MAVGACVTVKMALLVKCVMSPWEPGPAGHNGHPVSHTVVISGTVDECGFALEIERKTVLELSNM